MPEVAALRAGIVVQHMKSLLHCCHVMRVSGQIAKYVQGFSKAHLVQIVLTLLPVDDASVRPHKE